MTGRDPVRVGDEVTAVVPFASKWMTHPGTVVRIDRRWWGGRVFWVEHLDGRIPPTPYGRRDLVTEKKAGERREKWRTLHQRRTG